MFNQFKLWQDLVEVLQVFRNFMIKQGEINTLYEDKINCLIDRVSVLEDEIKKLKKQDL